MRKLEDGTLVEMPVVLPPTANPKDFRDNLLRMREMGQEEQRELATALENYIEEEDDFQDI